MFRAVPNFSESTTATKVDFCSFGAERAYIDSCVYGRAALRLCIRKLELAENRSGRNCSEGSYFWRDSKRWRYMGPFFL